MLGKIHTWCCGILVKKVGVARIRYWSFVEKGIIHGQRNDLTGGGLIRRTGGWTAVRVLRSADAHEKIDERILGDGAFIDRILSESQEALE